MVTIYSSDELFKLDDEQLRDIFFKIRSEIYSHKRNKKSTKDLEIYYCYVSRELEERKKNKK